MPQQMAAVVAAERTNIANEVINLVNDFRQSHGAPRLRVERKLMKVARSRAKAQARRGALNHSGWQSVLRRFGFRLNRGAGENLAHGFSGAAGAVRGWENSSGHRRNMLDSDFRTTGVAVVADKRGHLWYAQVFGGAK